MRERLRKALRWLLRLIGEQVVLPKLIALVFSGGLIIALIATWNRVCIAAIHLWQTPPESWTYQEMPILVIPLATLFLFLYLGNRFFRAIFKSKRRTYHYDFEPAGGMLWKYDSLGGFVEPEPYCPHNRTQLAKHIDGFRSFYYSCDHCSAIFGHFHDYEINNMYDAVCRTVRAKMEGHFRP